MVAKSWEMRSLSSAAMARRASWRDDHLHLARTLSLAQKNQTASGSEGSCGCGMACPVAASAFSPQPMVFQRCRRLIAHSSGEEISKFASVCPSGLRGRSQANEVSRLQLPSVCLGNPMASAAWVRTPPLTVAFFAGVLSLPPPAEPAVIPVLSHYPATSVRGYIPSGTSSSRPRRMGGFPSLRPPPSVGGLVPGRCVGRFGGPVPSLASRVPSLACRDGPVPSVPCRGGALALCPASCSNGPLGPPAARSDCTARRRLGHSAVVGRVGSSRTR